MGQDKIKENVEQKVKNCEYFAGWLSGPLKDLLDNSHLNVGISGVLVGAPFDVIKTKQQHLDIGFIDGAYTIKRLDGYSGFFRGQSLPLLLNGALNLVFYGMYSKAVERFTAPTGVDAWIKSEKSQESRSRHRINDPVFTSKLVSHNLGKRTEAPAKPKDDSSILMCMAAGAGANIALLAFACPMEVVKTRQQAYGKLVGGALNCIKSVYQIKGIRGLYKGLSPLAMRNVGGGMVQCATYTTIMRAVHPGDKKPTWTVVWLAGGMAGTLSWWAVAPLDVIKTKLQADEDMSPKYKGTLHCAKRIYSSQGVYGLFRGMMSLSLPAFIVNGVSFIGYNWALELCHDRIPSWFP